MENSNTDPNLTESEPSTSEQSTRTINNQTTTSERMERRKYKIPILSDRETDLTNIDPKMWWEKNFRMHPPDVQQQLGRNHRRKCTNHGSPHRIPHKRRRHLGTWTKSQTRNHERSVGPRIERC